MLRRIAVIATAAFVLLASGRSIGLAGYPSLSKESLSSVRVLSGSRVELKGDCDNVLFPGDDLVVTVENRGTANLSAGLTAYEASTGELLWNKEVPVGQVDRVPPHFVWSFPEAGILFVGAGPLTALEAKTGEVLWAREYDDLGLVWGVELGTSRMIVAGTKKPGVRFAVGATSQDVQEKLNAFRQHFKNPKLLCLDRQTGQTVWEYSFKGCKDDAMPSYQLLSRADSPGGDQQAIESTVTIIRGKHLYCLDNGDGKLVWEAENGAERAIAVTGTTVYANDGGQLLALDASSGKALWTGKDKVSKKANLSVCNDVVLAIDPGEFDPEKERFKGSYKISRLSPADGRSLGPEIKGDELCVIPWIGPGSLLVWDMSKVRSFELTSGTPGGSVRMDKDITLVCDLGDRWIGAGPGQLVSCDPPTGKTTWGLSLDRAERGKGLLGIFGFVGQLTGTFFIDPNWKPRDAGTDKYAATSIDPAGIIWPSGSDGVLGISADDGKLEWRLETENDPWTYFSDDGKTMAVVNKKVLRIVKL